MLECIFTKRKHLTRLAVGTNFHYGTLVNLS